jgi:hypothetical protein
MKPKHDYMSLTSCILVRVKPLRFRQFIFKENGKIGCSNCSMEFNSYADYGVHRCIPDRNDKNWRDCYNWRD